MTGALQMQCLIGALFRELPRHYCSMFHLLTFSDPQEALPLAGKASFRYALKVNLPKLTWADWARWTGLVLSLALSSPGLPVESPVWRAYFTVSS